MQGFEPFPENPRCAHHAHAADCRQQREGGLHGRHQPYGGHQPGQQRGHIGNQGNHAAVYRIHIAGKAVDQLAAVIGGHCGPARERASPLPL